jgi:acyl carrier protein
MKPAPEDGRQILQPGRTSCRNDFMMEPVRSKSQFETSDEQTVIDAVQVLLTRRLFIKAGTDDDLLATGLLDSLTIVRLIAYLEERFGLELPISDEGLESFRSASSIAELVQRRRARVSPGNEEKAGPP